MQETWVQPLAGKDPLEKELVTHSSILAWEVPWREEPCRLVHRVAKRPSNTTLPLNYNNKRMLTATHNNPKFCELYYFHEVHAFCHVSYKQLPFLVSFILETSFISPRIAPF